MEKPGIKVGDKTYNPDDFRDFLRSRVRDHTLDERIGSIPLQRLKMIGIRLGGAEQRPGVSMDEIIRGAMAEEGHTTLSERVQAGEMVVLKGVSLNNYRVTQGTIFVVDPATLIKQLSFPSEGKSMGLEGQPLQSYVAERVGGEVKILTDLRDKLDRDKARLTWEAMNGGMSLEMALIVANMLKILKGTTVGVSAPAAEAIRASMHSYDPLFDIIPSEEHEGRFDVKVNGAVHAVQKFGINAEWAVKRVGETLVAVNIEKMRGPHASEEDITEARNMIEGIHGASIHLITTEIQAAGGKNIIDWSRQLAEDSIIVARNLPLTFNSIMAQRKVGGIAIEDGGAGSHILYLSGGYPTLAGVRGLVTQNAAATGLIAIIDDRRGLLIVNPDERTNTFYGREIRYIEDMRKKRIEGMQHNPDATTKNGLRVRLSANAQYNTQLPEVNWYNIHDIGLFRGEGVLFELLQKPYLKDLTIGELYERKHPYGKGMERPLEDGLFDRYTSFIKSFNGNSISIRDLDIAGRDKPTHDVQKLFPDLRLENFAGGLDFLLAAPQLHIPNLRAIMRAAAYAQTKGKKIRLLVPMVQSREMLDEYIGRAGKVFESLNAEGVEAVRPDITVMFESPESIREAADILGVCNGGSIGTNDLIYFNTGIPRQGGDFPPVHPSVIGQIQEVVKVAEDQGKGVSICGQMAADPIGACIAVLSGVRILSVPAERAPIIKEILSQLDTNEHAYLLGESKRCHTYRELQRLWEDKFPAVKITGETPPFEIPS